MKVRINDENIYICKVSLGTVFLYEGEFFIKTEMKTNTSIAANAVNLESGEAVFIDDYNVVDRIFSDVSLN